MKKTSIIALILTIVVIAAILFCLVMRMFPAYRIYHGRRGDYTGINKLEPSILKQIDERIQRTLVNYNYINVSLVRNGEIVLTKSYGHDRLGKQDVYASVSKPVTAIILFELLKDGKIKSVDDDISLYHPRYKNALPEEHAGTYITFRHLLTHTSGVPHLSQLWNGDKLKLDFKPGTSVQYSSNGFGILGDVMEEITGKSYSQLIQDYIAEPIGAASFTVLIPAFLAPGGQVASSIEDMARFAIGAMEDKYIDNEILCNEMLKEYAKDRFGSIGLGWYCTNLDSSDLAGYHAGSNGRPRAFLAIKPYKKNAVALTGLNRSEKNPQVFGELTIDLMAIIENRSTSGMNVEN